MEDILTCTYEELDTLLASLDANTIDTAYKLQITEIPSNSVYTLKTKMLSRKDVYLDLSKTELPYVEGRSMYRYFKNCKTLVATPHIAAGISNLEECFYGCTSLKTVTNLPSMTEKLTSCFEGCVLLQTVPDIPSDVTTMTRTFFGCSSLEQSPLLPDSIKYMDFCFEGCESLSVVQNLPASCWEFGSCFFGCKNLVTVPDFPKVAYSVANCFCDCSSLVSAPAFYDKGIESLGGCFWGCSSLKFVPNIPSTVTNMNSCFRDCVSLESTPDIPKSVKSLYFCFANCKNLKNVSVIPESVTTIAFCFDGCVSLSEIYVFVDAIDTYDSVIDGSGVTTVYTNNKSKAEGIFGVGVTYQWLCKYDGLEALLAEREANTVDNPLKVKILDIPDDFVSTIATKLKTRTDVYLDLSPTTLPEVESLDSCFAYCKSLTSIPNLPDSVTSMSSCFDSCTSLTSVPNLPDSVTDMNYCFRGCKSLTSIPNLPDSVTSMFSCFASCTSLTSIPNIPVSVTDMNFCFFSCTSLTSVPNLPDSVISMSGCFYSCTSLTSVPNIPDSVTDMSSCFDSCTSLETIEDWQLLSLDGVTTTSAFSGCSALKEIKVHVSEPQEDYSLFHFKKTNGTNEFSFYQKGEKVSGTIGGGFGNLSVTGVIDEFAIGPVDAITEEIVEQVNEMKLPLSSLDKDFSPDDPHMVIWAKDKEKIKSNLLDEVNNAIQSLQNLFTSSNTELRSLIANVFSGSGKLINDLNDVNAKGVYYWSSGTLNRPPFPYGVCLCLGMYDGSTSGHWIYQIAFGTSVGIWVRKNINLEGWSNWNTLLSW